MHITAKDSVTPLKTPHGEVVHELIGRAAGPENAGHSVAHIVIPPGKAALRHYHPVAEESYVILAGQGLMELGDETRVIGPGESVLIPPPLVHKISNQGNTDLELLAICVPAWEPSNSVYLDDNAGQQAD